MLEEIFILIYIVVLLILYLLFRRVRGEPEEGVGYEDLFKREIKTLSLSARLKTIYLQLKLFFLRDTTIYVLILTTLIFSIIFTWNTIPSIQVLRSTYENKALNYAIAENNYSELLQPGIYRIALEIYRLETEETYVFKKNLNSSDILLITDSIYIVKCYDTPLLKQINIFLTDVCENNKVYVLGKDLPSKAVMIYDNKIFDIDIASLTHIKHPEIIPNTYSLYDLFDYKVYELGFISIIPRVIVLINENYASDLNISLDNAYLHRSILQISLYNRSIDDLLRSIEKKILYNTSTRSLILVYEGQVYVIKISDRDIIYNSFISTIFASLAFFGIFTIYIKSLEERAVRYLEATSYSGATDWISRISLVISFFLNNLLIITISILASIAVIQALDKNSISLGFPQFMSLFLGSFTGSLLSTIYLLRVLSEKSIYIVEKLPTKTYLADTIKAPGIEPRDIINDILRAIESCEFFSVLEKHVSFASDSGRALIRAIYTYTLGIGVDIYVFVSRSGEAYSVNIDLDPWSIEEIPFESLDTVSRLILSRIRGYLGV